MSNSSNEVRTWSAAAATNGLFTNSVYAAKVSAAAPAFMARSVLPSPTARMGRGSTRHRKTAAFPSCETSGDARSKPAYLPFASHCKLTANTSSSTNDSARQSGMIACRKPPLIAMTRTPERRSRAIAVSAPEATFARYASDSARTSSSAGAMRSSRSSYTSCSACRPLMASAVSRRTNDAVSPPRRSASQSMPSTADSVESTSSTTVKKRGVDIDWSACPVTGCSLVQADRTGRVRP